MNLKNRLSKLEQVKRKMAIEADCICFPPDEPPHLELQPEIEAARSVRCPLHGERFKSLAPTLSRVIRLTKSPIARSKRATSTRSASFATS
jgi:hypothetical protein